LKRRTLSLEKDCPFSWIRSRQD